MHMVNLCMFGNVLMCSLKLILFVSVLFSVVTT